MKKIVVNGKHAEKLETALNAVQTRCTARTLTVHEIERILEATTRRLGISKKALTGTTLHHTGAEAFPSAYKYRPESAHFFAVFDGRHWSILNICRDDCPDRSGDTDLTLSDSAKAALIDRFSRFNA